MNILAVCFQASPTRGSEYSVGWGWLAMIASEHKVWVITNDSAKEEIERYQSSNNSIQHVHFLFVDWSQKHVGSILWPIIRPFRYRAWRKKALHAAKLVCSEKEIDVCHYVNAVGFLDVVPLWETGRPFVWGPVGGLSLVPASLLSAVNFKAKIFYSLKNVVRYAAIRWARLPRKAAIKSAAIIAATEESQQCIRKYWEQDSAIIPEIGMSKSTRLSTIPERSIEERLRIVWSGRLDSRKQPKILLEAAGKLESGIDFELHILGDGPQKQSMISLSQKLGIADRCLFYGMLPRDQAIEIMEKGHLFVLTSIHDLTTNVLVEALNCGLPVICFSSHAASYIVGHDSGIAIPIDSSEKITDQISYAISWIFANENKRQQLARNALGASNQFDWAQKKAALSEVYNSLPKGQSDCKLASPSV